MLSSWHIVWWEFQKSKWLWKERLLGHLPSQELHWRAMEGYEDQLGKSHPESLRVTSDLASLLQDCLWLGPQNTFLRHKNSLSSNDFEWIPKTSNLEFQKEFLNSWLPMCSNEFQFWFFNLRRWTNWQRRSACSASFGNSVSKSWAPITSRRDLEKMLRHFRNNLSRIRYY